MNPFDFPPFAAVLDAAYSLLADLVGILQPMAGDSSAAFAVVLVTLAVRAVLVPVGISQARAERGRRRLAPMLAELKRRWSTRPDLLRKKTLELYAAQKVSPFAGCLPLLAQGPVLSIVYALFGFADIAGHSNLLLTAVLAGVPLGASLFVTVQAAVVWPAIIVHLGVIAVVALSAWLSRRLVVAQQSEQPEKLASALSWMPFITVLFAAIAPLAAAVYLAVSTTWTALERRIVRRLIVDRP